MDTYIIGYLNSLAGQGADPIIVFLAEYSQYLIGIFVLAFAFWPTRRWRMLLAGLVSAVVARLGIKTIILFFVHRPRPYVVLSDIRNVVGPQIGEEYQSFPSGHALFFFALAMGIYMYDRRLGWAVFIGATLMGLARIIGGIHWPSDVIGGAIMGMLLAWLMVRFIPTLKPRPNA